MLQKYDIQNKECISYVESKNNTLYSNKHLQRIIQSISDQKAVALVSDAGLPGVSDPGNMLVNECHERGLPVISIPSASSVTTAISVSGFLTTKFCFEGFLPPNRQKRKILFEEWKSIHNRSIVFFENPNRIQATIKELQEVFGKERKICICRELTKKFETIFRESLEQVEYYLQELEKENKEVLGEFTCVLEPLLVKE